MLEKSTLNGTDEVLKAQANAIENFVVCDLPGFADFADQLPTEKQRVGKEGARWWGGMTYQQSVAALRYGDMAGVAASDKLLAEMETLVTVSQSWRTHNSVVGMCPNVPAVPRRQSLQHEAETAMRDHDGASIDICRTGRERRHRRKDVPKAWGSDARAGSHAGEPQAGGAVVRHRHRAAEFPVKPLRPPRHAALGLGAERARLHPPQRL